MNTRIRSEQGIAVIVAMMAMMLMTALGTALILTTSSETMITGNYRNSSEGLYAADAAMERSVDDLLTVADWNNLLNGSVRSPFIDGDPSGERTLPDGTKINLTHVINLANCEKTSDCSEPEMDTSTDLRPWGDDNPRWQLYSYGPLTDLVPTGTVNSQFYAVVLVADDPSENDGDPAKDGVVTDPEAADFNPGSGVLAMRAEAFGPRGAHKVIELTVARTDTTELERGYTGQRGQDEQNRRARKAAVGSVGKGLENQLFKSSGGL
jgi:hypothetical protein